jgi:hypothetical protein
VWGWLAGRGVRAGGEGERARRRWMTLLILDLSGDLKLVSDHLKNIVSVL